MSFIRTAWACGGVVALALGMAAEACSSTNAATTTTGDGGGGGSTNGCALLSSCCMSLSPTVEANSSCATIIASANNQNCASYLTTIQATGDCTGTGTSSGTSASSSTGTGTATSTSSTMSTSTGTATSSASTSCGKVPSLYPESAPGVYCPFSTAGSGGKAGTCAAGQECCEPYSGTSTCEAAGSTCPVVGSGSSTVWSCLEAMDCPSGQICCGTGTLTEEPACGTNPAYAKVTGLKSTNCAASCGSNFILCGTNAQCPSGQTCVATAAQGQDFGHCSSTGM